MGDSQSRKARGKLGLRDGVLQQTVSRLPIANQVFLGFWTVDIRQEGRSQRSSPERRPIVHLRRQSRCAPRKPSGWDGGGDKMPRPTWGVCAGQAPGHLSCSDLGRAQNAGPTESVPLWSTREPEPEQLRPGKCTQPRGRSGEFPCRASWSLTGKAHTLRAEQIQCGPDTASAPHTCQCYLFAVPLPLPAGLN